MCSHTEDVELAKKSLEVFSLQFKLCGFYCYKSLYKCRKNHGHCREIESVADTLSNIGGGGGQGYCSDKMTSHLSTVLEQNTIVLKILEGGGQSLPFPIEFILDINIWRYMYNVETRAFKQQQY